MLGYTSILPQQMHIHFQEVGLYLHINIILLKSSVPVSHSNRSKERSEEPPASIHPLKGKLVQPLELFPSGEQSLVPARKDLDDN